MKNSITLFLLFFSIANIYSQITFEKGYYINNDDYKTECFIKNYDWKNNPTEIEFKISKDNSSRTIKIDKVKEFSIDNYSKYIRANVEIDRSSHKLNELSSDRNPIFKNERLFLKVLVEGKYSLYQFSDGSIVRYFYKNGDKIEQLVHKSYFVGNDIVKKNNRFRQQLLSSIECSEIGDRKFEKLNYKKNDLIAIFESANKCNNQDFISYEKLTTKDLFNLTLRPRISLSSLKVQRGPNIDDYGSKVGFGFGVEAEFILNFNKNKWSLLFEPTFRSYSSETDRFDANYKSIELHAGVRHYFFLENNNNNKVYFNGLILLRDIAINSEVSNIKASSVDNSLSFGLGFKKGDKYSAELRFVTNRNITANHFFGGSEYNSLSLVFGYNLF